MQDKIENRLSLVAGGILLLAAIACGDHDCPDRPIAATRGTAGWEVVVFVPADAPGGIAEHLRMNAADVEAEIYETADMAITYREGAR